MSLSLKADNAPSEVWEKYYGLPAPRPTCYEKYNKCNINPSSNQIFIYKSVFEDDSDGVVNVTQNGIKFIHNLCFFENCTKNDNGGAIYFNCNGFIVQRRFCTINAYTRKSNGLGCHSFSYLIDKSPNDNLIIDSSICQCSSVDSKATIYSKYGNIGLLSSNVSKNSIKKYPGFFYVSATQKGTINFSTFESNHAHERICLYQSNSDYLYEYCNVINNTQFLTDYGTFYIHLGNVNIKNSTILQSNKNGTTFSSTYRVKGNFFIVNCNIDSLTTTSSASISTKAITNTESFSIIDNVFANGCSDLLISPVENTIDLSDYSLVQFLFPFIQKIFIIFEIP